MRKGTCMKIEVKPITQYKTPNYPDLEKAATNPDLLKKLPERWRYNKAVITTILALSSFALSGCGMLAEGGSLQGIIYIPPFITEEEALSIIKNEALKYGVNLDDIPSEKNIAIPNNYGESAISSEAIYNNTIGIDISDNEKGIAIAYDQYGDDNQYYKKAAKDGIPYNTGIFTYPDEEVNALERKIYDDSNVSNKQDTISREVKSMIEEDLRVQVKDFIEWLRGQGII